MKNKIYSLLSAAICLVLVLTLAGCKRRYQVETVYYTESVPGGVDVLVEVPDDDEDSFEVEDYSDDTTSETQDITEIASSVYYVSKSGSDANDGLSEKTAWATINKVNIAGLLSGDKVLFRRGDEWRGETITCVKGVTYGAYGNGKNPVLTGSPKNYSIESLWVTTDQPDIYKLNEKFGVSDDVGNIIFNDGKSCAIKVRDGLSSLEDDLSFYHNSDGYVYLRCDNGNPAKVFSTIDIVTRKKLIVAKGNNTIENLSLRYANFGLTTSSHIPGDVDGITVRNCEFSWIGGCIATADDHLRLGNAIELWGCCSNVLIENCEFTQIFDTAFTTQCTGNGTVDTVTVRNNKIDKCFWGMEFWLQGNGQSKMNNILIEGNTFTNTAEGWSSNQRWASLIIHGAHITDLGYKDFKRTNFVIKNNTFGNSAAMLIKLTGTNWTPVIEGNTYKQFKDMAFGYIGNKSYTFDDEFINNQLKKIDKQAIASYQ